MTMAICAIDLRDGPRDRGERERHERACAARDQAEGAADGGGGEARALAPCPRCGGPVAGRAAGGVAAFGCGEWAFEVECPCGVSFEAPGPYETPAEAEAEGARLWNARGPRAAAR